MSITTDRSIIGQIEHEIRAERDEIAFAQEFISHRTHPISTEDLEARTTVRESCERIDALRTRLRDIERENELQESITRRLEGLRTKREHAAHDVIGLIEAVEASLTADPAAAAEAIASALGCAPRRSMT